MEGYHEPVLLREAVVALKVQKGKWYLDCTLGDGGHSLGILRFGGKVLGVDVDPEAIERAKERLGKLGKLGLFGNVKFVQGNFRDLKNLISPASTAKRGKQMDTDRSKFAGAIFDLGVSSLQIENPERGFSFAKMGPLDMRMDPSLAIKALDLVNNLSRKELYELFKTLGEEKHSWRLAAALELARQIKPFATTGDLADVVVREVGGFRGKIHPATRVFQALRIAVNDELGALQEGLNQVKDLIEKKGRILVVSFHSLEDRIVKQTFRSWESAGVGMVITKKPIIPSDDEAHNNPRSRSAKLRVFEMT